MNTSDNLIEELEDLMDDICPGSPIKGHQLIRVIQILIDVIKETKHEIDKP